MRLADLERALAAAVAARDDATLARHPLAHRAGAYDLLRIASRGIAPGDPLILLRAGIHGDETSGPITLARHLGEVLDHAHRRGVKVLCYPLGNPSGYDRGLRYNADHDTGEGGNNDFLRYRFADGTFGDSVPPGGARRDFCWSSDPRLGIALPAETRLMHDLLRREPIGQIRAALDLHQDHLTPGAPAAAYHYGFGDLAQYDGIVERLRGHCALLAGCAIGAGFGTRIDAHGAVLGAPEEDGAPRSDERGFIERHDGTLSDLLYRLGVRHSIAAETTGATPMDAAVGVNLAWIEGLIDLVAGERREGRVDV